MGDKLLAGIIDMHVHSHPDLRPRAYDDLELMEAGIRVGARAIVLKTHQGATMDRAYLCNRHNQLVNGGDNGFTMLGSITLNRPVGGLNPRAVDVALRLGAKVVWLPTMDAQNHIRKLGRDPSQGIPVVKDGHIVPELSDIFALCRAHDAVLGTGHIAPEECEIVVQAACAAGLTKIVVTHPEWWLVGMDMAMQKRMAWDYGAVLERCFAQNMGGGAYKSNLDINAQAIREIGHEHILLSTDGGQIENPHWEIAAAQTLSGLLALGIPREQLDFMTHVLPARLLGLS